MVRQVIYDKRGKLVADVSYDTPSNSQMTYSLTDSSVKSIQIYGDWRYDEDTPAETDDTAVPVIGEVAGTQVTPDMLNPDGTVTIDGTTTVVCCSCCYNRPYSNYDVGFLPLVSFCKENAHTKT